MIGQFREVTSIASCASTDLATGSCHFAIFIGSSSDWRKSFIVKKRWKCYPKDPL